MYPENGDDTLDWCAFRFAENRSRVVTASPKISTAYPFTIGTSPYAQAASVSNDDDHNHCQHEDGCVVTPSGYLVGPLRRCLHRRIGTELQAGFVCLRLSNSRFGIRLGAVPK